MWNIDLHSLRNDRFFFSQLKISKTVDVCQLLVSPINSTKYTKRKKSKPNRSLVCKTIKKNSGKVILVPLNYHVGIHSHTQKHVNTFAFAIEIPTYCHAYWMYINHYHIKFITNKYGFPDYKFFYLLSKKKTRHLFYWLIKFTICEFIVFKYISIEYCV